MKTVVDTAGLDRRTLLSTLAAVPVLPGLLSIRCAQAQTPTSPLASWNDGPQDRPSSNSYAPPRTG
jgi:hypothetical protein